MKKHKTICVDFDGVIHKYSKGWQDGSIYDDPIDGAKQALEGMINSGYKVIIFTIRMNPKVNKDVPKQRRLMKKWFIKHGFILGKHYHSITAMKPSAIAYIDDHAVYFTKWTDIIEKLK